MSRMTFPPALSHGPITPVVDGVYLVRGGYRMGPGVVISRTMTVVQNPDGLVVLNAMRLSVAGLAELDRLGKVKHLVKLSESHGVDEPFYVDRYKPEVWAMPDAKFNGGITATKVLGPACPIAGGIVVDFPGSAGWKERGLWIPNAGGTLISCDALQNHVDGEHSNAIGRFMSSMMGFKGGVIVAPMWRKMQKLQGAQVKQALAGISQLSFANLVTGHGPAVVGNAGQLTKTAIERASA
jgi:hypothetical protein